MVKISTGKSQSPARERWAKRCDKCGFRVTWYGKITDKPPCPKCTKRPVKIDPDCNEEIDEALSQCDSILSLIDELPSAGYDFGESVAEKVGSIRDWTETHSTVTNGQLDALDNMESGVSRWLD